MQWNIGFIFILVLCFVQGKPRTRFDPAGDKPSALHNFAPGPKKDAAVEGRGGSRPVARSNLPAAAHPDDPSAGVRVAPQPHQPDAQTQRKLPNRKKWFSLVSATACKKDVLTLCPKSSQTNNFLIIDCLERDDATTEKVSPPCQHVVWEFKRNMTHSSVFAAASHHVCDPDFQNITECQSSLISEQQKLACFFEFKHRMKNPDCLTFMNRVGTIFFSDYHLIYNFARECNSEIEKFHCGRLSGRTAVAPGEEDKKDLPSTQGRVIECLLDKVDVLNKKCAHEIMRVAELQADDYHLDRPLYFACRGDREKLCRDVSAGEGQVYKCLMKAATNPDMSSECKKHLTKRMALRSRHYKVDYSFAGFCEADVKKLKCFKDEELSNPLDGISRSVPIAQAILCVEEAVKLKNYEVTPECMSEIFDIRKQMMSDFRISPEILLHCKNPIEKHCGNGLKRNGATLHCLMDQYKGKVGQPGSIEPNCAAALKNLIKVADPGSDYRVDPVIGQACQAVIQSSCSSDVSSPGAVLSCLLNNMDSSKMTEYCSEKLLELQYILSRDFTLDVRLYKSCYKDAEKLCSSNKSDWSGTNVKKSTQSLIFSCLFRNMQARELASEIEDEKEDEKDDEEDEKPKKTNEILLSKTCSSEVLRSLRERSSRVMLNPYVYDNCMADLAQFCTQSAEGHHEMRCLQNHYDDIKNKACKDVVQTYTAEQERHPSLDHIMAAACQPMIKQFCAHEAQTDSGQIMPCLIRNKNHPDMNVKCSAGVEHHQIISMKDFRISHAFRRACSHDLNKHCSAVRTKTDAITCLSEIIRNNTLLDKEVPLNRGCRQQVRAENLQKSQDIRLSPRLQRACAQDLRQHCKEVPKDRKIQCLRRQKWSELTPRCQKLIFMRVQLESMDSRIDARLQRVCKSMIKHYCTGHEKDALDCLWKHIHDDSFDTKCRRVVYLRLETRARDFRLDPLITHLCKHDIRKRCASLLDPRNNMTGSEYRGRVTACLKKHYRDFELSKSCHAHMRQLIVETNMNHHMDPILRRACEKDVQRSCATELEESDGRDGDGNIVECLKRALSKAKIKSHECQKETLRLMEEGRADVHVDPVLYQACRHELGTICQNTPLGNGKQMACLLWAKDDREASKGMSYTCRKQVQLRAEMWEMAAKLAPPETLHELAIQITTSNAKNYFFAFLAIVVLVIFVFGLCFGRVTKRVRVDVKNK